MTSIHLPELRKVFTTPEQTRTVSSSEVTAQNLVNTFRSQEQVASQFNTERGSRKEALMARARKVAFIGLCAVTAVLGANELLEEDPKPTVLINADQGDTAMDLAREFNPNDKDILNESDFIHKQVDPTQPIGTQELEIPFDGTIPEGRQDNIVKRTENSN